MIAVVAISGLPHRNSFGKRRVENNCLSHEFVSRLRMTTTKEGQAAWVQEREPLSLGWSLLLLFLHLRLKPGCLETRNSYYSYIWQEP